MAITQEQYNRIVSYLNNLLTPEEEIVFVEELNQNAELQQEFDFELVLRQSTNPDHTTGEAENNAELESAETHLAKAKMILQHRSGQTPAGNNAKVVRLKPDYKKIISIAALFLIIATFLVFYFKKKHETDIAHTGNPVEKGPGLQKKDTGVIRQQLNNDDTGNQVLLADNLTADEAFHKNYSRYKKSGEDPVQVSRYFIAYYYDRNYKDVFDATPEDYATKGDDDSLSNSYVEFYKALSWIETGKPGNAIIRLKKLSKYAETGLSLGYFAQWYLAMAYLKNNDITGAKKTLKAIVTGKKFSPYKTKANQLLTALK